MFKYSLVFPVLYIFLVSSRGSVAGSIIGIKTTKKESTYLPSTQCSREHISTSLRGQAPCKPRDKVIVIPWPNNTDVHQLTPTHVTVRRCSGGCHQDHQSCVASLTRTREVPVILGKCPVSGGKCEKECASVEVEDEVECECGCRRKEDECGEKHQWMSDTCECECKDSVGRTECLEGGPGRVWDSTQCECVCPVTLSCHTGMEYDQTTCSCQPSIAPQDINAEEREVRSETQDSIAWEHVIIIVLGCLLVIFFFIIISLLCRIHTLKIHSYSTSSQIPSIVSDNVYIKSPKESKEKLEKSNLQMFSSSSDISSPPQCCSDKCTDSSFYSDSPESSHTSVYRQTPSYIPTQPSYQRTPYYPPYQYANLTTLQEDDASECCSLMGKETNI